MDASFLYNDLELALIPKAQDRTYLHMFTGLNQSLCQILKFYNHLPSQDMAEIEPTHF